jgi:ABC-type amino acid transport system permease subunit
MAKVNITGQMVTTIKATSATVYVTDKDTSKKARQILNTEDNTITTRNVALDRSTMGMG